MAGRPRTDWEDRYRRWVKSGLPKGDFLRVFCGVSGKSGDAWTKTRDWESRLAEGPAEDRKAYQAAREASSDPAMVIDIGPKRRRRKGEKAAVAEAREKQRVPDPEAAAKEREQPIPEPQAWQVIQQWRRKQAAEDYRTADSVRMHLKLLLRTSLHRVSENGAEVLKTMLKPSEVRALSLALLDIQKVQRLALGLTTENLGVDQPITDTHVEKNVTPDDPPIPTFVVEVSRAGKFLRPRPRRVS